VYRWHDIAKEDEAAAHKRALKRHGSRCPGIPFVVIGRDQTVCGYKPEQILRLVGVR